MALTLRQVVLDTTDPRTLAEFYRRLLGLVYAPGDEPPADAPDALDWLRLRSPDGAPVLAFQQVDALPRSTWPTADVPQQLHLDLTVDSPEGFEASHALALSLGATLLLDRAADPEERLRVYADPSGHPFCIFLPG